MWEKARSLERKKEFLCDCPHSLKLKAYSYLLVFRIIFASDENEIVNSKGYFCCREVWDMYLCGSVCFFSPFFVSGRIINGDPTFSAPVTPVIRSCWQLKVKFIVTRGPRLRRHIKNGLSMQSCSWKQTQGMRRDQRSAPVSFSSLQRYCSDGGMCVSVSVYCGGRKEKSGRYFENTKLDGVSQVRIRAEPKCKKKNVIYNCIFFSLRNAIIQGNVHCHHMLALEKGLLQSQ